MSKHTPGPWVCMSGEVYRESAPGVGSYRLAVMDREVQHTRPTERDANALLIAAAPDLLAACEKAHALLYPAAFVSVEGDSDETYLALVTAIAKARGEK